MGGGGGGILLISLCTPIYIIAYRGGGGGQKWLKCCVRTIWMPPKVQKGGWVCHIMLCGVTNITHVWAGYIQFISDVSYFIKRFY